MFVVFGSNDVPRPQPAVSAAGGHTFPPDAVSPAKAEEANAKEPSDTTKATSKTRSCGVPKREVTPRDTGLLIPHPPVRKTAGAPVADLPRTRTAILSGRETRGPSGRLQSLAG